MFIDVKVTVPGYGEITVDVSYGGALYAFVNAEIFGLDVNKSRTRDLVDAATAVTNAVKSQVHPKHQAHLHKTQVLLRENGALPSFIMTGKAPPSCE